MFFPRPIRLWLGAFLLSGAALQAQQAAASGKWLFSYDELSAPALGYRKGLTVDRHFLPFLLSNFGSYGTAADIRAHVAVSEQIVGVVANRFITFEGCMAHMCDSNSGLLWLDTQPRKSLVLFAMLDEIYTPPVRNVAPRYFGIRIYSSQTVEQHCFDHCFPKQFLDSLQLFLQQPSGRHLLSSVVVNPDGREFPILPWTLHVEGVTPASSEIRVRVHE